MFKSPKLPHLKNPIGPIVLSRQNNLNNSKTTRLSIDLDLLTFSQKIFDLQYKEGFSFEKQKFVYLLDDNNIH